MINSKLIVDIFEISEAFTPGRLRRPQDPLRLCFATLPHGSLRADRVNKHIKNLKQRNVEVSSKDASMDMMGADLGRPVGGLPVG
jgi:hypothetical protein